MVQKAYKDYYLVRQAKNVLLIADSLFVKAFMPQNNIISNYYLL